MDWAEVSIHTSHEAMDLVAEIFHGLGASGVVIEDPALLNDYIDSGQWDYTDIPRAENTAVVIVQAYLALDSELPEKLRELERRMGDLPEEIDSSPGKISWSKVKDEDWSESWKKYFHTAKIGERIVIKPTWERYDPLPEEAVIELDPGAAFGTGTHPTTMMCLQELERLMRPGLTVFDVGTGSGVLAIAAAKLGAAKVTALDYDSTAVRVAEENIRQNKMQDKISLGVSDLLAAAEGQADIITANIIADIIIRLLDDVGKYLRPHGRLLASGIIEDRVADVTAAAEEEGFAIERINEDKGWAVMVICRRSEL